MQHYDYLIIGGGLAGGKAVEGIRKITGQGTIALITREPYRPYQRPPLSKGYLQGKDGRDKAFLEDEAWYPSHGAVLYTGVEATKIDRGAHTVTTGDGRVLQYGKLLLATGGQPRRLDLPGADLPGVHLLRTIPDSDAIRGAVKKGTRVLVMGGSFIGSEVAASTNLLGGEVTMIFPEERLLERVVPAEMSAHLAQIFGGHGVKINAGITAKAIDGDGKVERVTLSDGSTMPVDLVIMGVGITLDTALAQAAGLEMEKGAVLVDDYLATSDPDIYAAGDIASWPSRLYGKRLRVEHWDVASHQGLRAGRNMAGEHKPYRTLPYFFSDIFDLSFDAYGDLSEWEQTVLRGSVEKDSFAYFYFRGGVLTASLAVGRPKAEGKAMPDLVKEQIRYNDAANKLTDESVALDTLLAQQ